MRHIRILLLFLLLSALFSGQAGAENRQGAVFSTLENKEQFAGEISILIEEAWKKWQDGILINNIDIEGSQGVLRPGGMGKSVLTASDIMLSFDKSEKPRDYIDCIKAVAGAVENGMRSWQRGYTHTNIPFPQGASCTFTLPPCNNVPVTVASGWSSGDGKMTEGALYNYMLYHAPREEQDILILFRGAARAISECFVRWKESCYIVGIMGNGGIAPHPAPMGTGPGPVRGARGKNGMLEGSYFDGSLMYSKMMEYFSKQRTN